MSAPEHEDWENWSEDTPVCWCGKPLLNEWTRNHYSERVEITCSCGRRYRVRKTVNVEYSAMEMDPTP